MLNNSNAIVELRANLSKSLAKWVTTTTTTTNGRQQKPVPRAAAAYAWQLKMDIIIKQGVILCIFFNEWWFGKINQD